MPLCNILPLSLTCISESLPLVVFQILSVGVIPDLDPLPCLSRLSISTPQQWCWTVPGMPGLNHTSLGTGLIISCLYSVHLFYSISILFLYPMSSVFPNKTHDNDENVTIKTRRRFCVQREYICTSSHAIVRVGLVRVNSLGVFYGELNNTWSWRPERHFPPCCQNIPWC